MPRAVFILMACISLIGASALILSPVLRDIAADFDTSVATAARAIAAFGAGTALTALLLGRHIDGFGVARALRLAMIAAGLAQILASQSVGWTSLAIAEALVGAASGVALPAIYAITAEISPKGQAARTMGAVLLGWSVSLVFAIPIGAALGDILGWRLMLVVLGGLSIATVAFTGRFRNTASAQNDALPIGRLAPLLLPGGWSGYLTCGLFMTAFYGTYAFSGPYVIQVFGQSTAGAGLVALGYGTGFGLASMFGRIIDRIGAWRAKLRGFAVAAAVLSGLALAGSFPLFLLGIAFWGAINNILLNAIVTSLTALAPGSKGAVLGLYTSVTYIAAAIGTFGLGLLFELAGFRAVALGAAMLQLTALGVMILSRKPNTL